MSPTENIEPKEVFEQEKVKVQEYPILQTMSEEDAYISDRMKSQPKTLDEVLLVKEKNMPQESTDYHYQKS